MWRKTHAISALVVLVLVFSAIGVSSAFAAVVAEIPVSVGPGSQHAPAIYGNKIVWQDERGTDAEIYVYDILTGVESAVTSDTVNQMLPDIYQDLVVYEDARNAPRDVYLLDLATGVELQLTPTGTRQDHAAIWGETVVWRDLRAGTFDIYARSLSTGFETLLTANAYDQEDPDVWGDLVVYQDNRNGNWEIYAYDLSVGNESRITDQAADQTGPKVSDTLIAWTDDRLGSDDVWAYDLATQTEFLVAGGVDDQVLQGVYGDRVVYIDQALATTFMYDDSLGTSGVLPVAGTTDDLNAAIFGDKIAIAGTGVVSGTWDLFMVTVDEDAPTTSISGVPAGWSSQPVTVTLTADDTLEGSGVDATYYALDGGPAVEYTGATVFTTEGTTQFDYWSVDLAGNIEDTQTATIRVDTLAPTTTSDIDPAWQVGPVTVTLSADDGDGSGVEWTLYSVDGSDLQPYTAPFVVSGEGVHTVTYASADALGHAEAIQTEYVRIDDSAPVTTSDIDPAWQVGPVTVTLTAVDPYSSVADTFYSTDDSTPTVSYSGPFDITAEGTTTVKFYSVDALGHEETVTVEYVHIDDTAPVTTSDIDPAWQTGPVSVTLTATDPYSGVAATYYSTDDSTPTVLYTSPLDITAEGTTTVKFYSVDAYGHEELVTTEMVRIDNSAPVTTSDIDPAWQVGPVMVTLSATDAYSGVAATFYSTDGSLPTTLSTGSFMVSADGTTTVKYYSVDMLGHAEGVKTEYVRIDNRAPVTTSDIDPAWQNGPVTVTLTATDDDSGPVDTFYSVDGSYPGVTYTVPFDITAEGTTTVMYYSVDAFGHIETVKTEYVHIDNSAPVTTSDIDPAWQNGPVTVTLSAVDPGSGVVGTYYYIDGLAPARAYTGPFDIAAEGATAVTYYSIDGLGQVETATTEFVSIDDSAPMTTSDIDPAWQTSPVTVTLTAVDPLSGVAATYYSVDGSFPGVTYTVPFDITAEGTTTVQFYSVDMLGNTETVTTETVQIDDTAPVTTDDAPTDWQTSPVVVTLSPTDAFSGVAATYYSLDGSIPTVVYHDPIAISAEDTTTITYYSVDVYGHVEETRTAQVLIDDTIPETHSDIDSAWRSTPATVTLTTNAWWTYYSTDGSDPGITYTVPFEVAAEGTTTVKYRSETRAHVFEDIQSELVRIDYTPPVSSTDASGTFWDLAYIPVEATDAMAGVAQTFMRLDGGVTQTVSSISVTSLGEHTVEFWSVDTAGNVESIKTHDFTVKPSSTDYTTISGANRILTAIEVSQESYPGGSDYVVLATGNNWPDALGGSALAGVYDAPILLVNGSLPDAVADEIRRLAPEKALILGGIGAVSEDIEAEVRGIVGVGAVERFWGANRYLTADAIAYRVLERLGTGYDGTAFVVTGADYPDAVAASPMAAANGWPVFLADTDGLSAHSLETMDDIDVTRVIVIGGEGVVSAGIFDGLETKYGVGNVERLAGRTRYATALEAARFGTTEGGLIWDGLAVATGEGFADALTGGVLQGLKGSTMVLTKPDELPAVVDAELVLKRDYIGEVTYLGGDAAVGPAVKSRIGQILR